MVSHCVTSWHHGTLKVPLLSLHVSDNHFPLHQLGNVHMSMFVQSRCYGLTELEAAQYHELWGSGCFVNHSIEITKTIFIFSPIATEVHLGWDITFSMEYHHPSSTIHLHVTPSLHHWELFRSQQEWSAVLVTHTGDFIHPWPSRVGLW